MRQGFTIPSCSGPEVQPPPAAPDAGERLAAGLLLVAGVVLVIAVTNLAGMLLARGVTRRTEMAVRLTLGASRWQVTRRLLVEGWLLAVTGGFGGLLFAKLLTVVFMEQTPSAFGRFETVAFSLDVPLDANVLWYTALLLVSGVVAKPLLEAERVSPGYEPDGLAFVDFGFPPTRYTGSGQGDYEKERERHRRFNQSVLEVLGATPGVTSVALTMGMPESAMKGWIIARDAFPNGQHWWVAGATVSSDYFQTLGVRVTRGRPFDIRDQPDSPKVAIIDETLAMWLWPGENPVGRYVAQHFPDSNYPPEWREVIGVVNEVQPPITTGSSNPYLYEPMTQGGHVATTIVARAAMPMGDLVRTLRQTALDADPEVELLRSGTVSESIAAMLYPRRMAAGILTAAGFIGLVLSAAGLFGVISYSVAQRLRELGIRATLGATRRSLMGLVLREGGRVAAVGAVLGLVVAYVGIRLTSSLIVAIPQLDMVVVTAVPLLLGVVVLAACFVPARRASKVDPIVVLRNL